MKLFITAAAASLSVLAVGSPAAVAAETCPKPLPKTVVKDALGKGVVRQSTCSNYTWENLEGYRAEWAGWSYTLPNPKNPVYGTVYVAVLAQKDKKLDPLTIPMGTEVKKTKTLVVKEWLDTYTAVKKVRGGKWVFVEHAPTAKSAVKLANSQKT